MSQFAPLNQFLNRVHQSVLVISTLILSWLGMMVLHELGHVIGAWCTGGKIARVVLHPMAISRTDLAHNPRPLHVAWSGPGLGVVLPVAAWLVALACRMPGTHVLRFFAGFCLLANGAYIGVGSLNRIGDAGDLLRHGASLWQLWLFGLVLCPLGLLLWHGLGPHFGLGECRSKVNVTTAYVCFSLLVLLVVVELFFSAA